MKKLIKNGFTLAEVLITLAIIGVVAAMTLPTLIQKHQKQQWATGLQVAVSTLQNGFKKMMADDGVDNIYETEFFSDFACGGVPSFHGDNVIEHCKPKLEKYFKLAGADSLERRVKMIQLRGSFEEMYFFNSENYFLSNGIRVNFCTGLVEIDINGDKKPNELGRDVFWLTLNPSGILTGVYAEMPDMEYSAMFDDISRQFTNDQFDATEWTWLNTDYTYAEAVQYIINETNKATSQQSDNKIKVLPELELGKSKITYVDSNYFASKCPNESRIDCTVRIMNNGWKMDY